MLPHKACFSSCLQVPAVTSCYNIGLQTAYWNIPFLPQVTSGHGILSQHYKVTSTIRCQRSWTWCKYSPESKWGNWGEAFLWSTWLQTNTSFRRTESIRKCSKRRENPQPIPLDSAPIGDGLAPSVEWVQLLKFGNMDWKRTKQ